MKFPKACVLSLALVGLASCAASFRYAPYECGKLEETPFQDAQTESYRVYGDCPSLSSSDMAEIPATLGDIYAIGPSKRNVVPSLGKQYLTVIPVDFVDVPASQAGENAFGQLKQAFFGDGAFNQYVSLAEYYDKASFHRFQVEGEVTPTAYRSEESYASLKTKVNASQTKAALTNIYVKAVAWYNNQPFKTHELHYGDPVYFVYLAPYSGMDGGATSRSSMMWAFTINDPAPICWSSFYMTHPRGDGSVDAHTFIHEFGHMLGLKDYYDQSSYAELSPCSPLGRMDMMDCSLGEHNAFSKAMLGWLRPKVVTGVGEFILRPYSGNGDSLLLPLESYNGTPYDEYVLLEFYTPSYLNYADAALRAEAGMTLMKDSGVKAYHVDGRLGCYDDRSKSPRYALTPSTPVGPYCLDLYCDNSGAPSGGYAHSVRGFLAHSLSPSVPNGELIENFIASDHDEDLPYGDKVAHLRNVLYQAGQGESTGLSFHKGGQLPFGFEVTEVTPTYAKVRTFANETSA